VTTLRSTQGGTGTTSESVRCVRVTGAGRESVEDRVAVEAPLELRLGGERFVVTMRTPGHDAELAAGLLLAEGLVRTAADLGAITESDGAVDVEPAAGKTFDTSRGLARRGTLSTGACGVCGRAGIDDLLANLTLVTRRAPLAASVVRTLTSRLSSAQPVFAETGGLHAAAIADSSGALLVVREDVGRHNAVDKVVGRLLLDGLLPGDALALVVSGRVSFELVQKAAAAGIPLIAGVSAPSSLAVETADRAGVTLVAFARGEAFNVYTHAAGIAFDPG
jgi:FdhD protein